MVFVAIGVPYDTAEYFRSAMENSGALEHTALFLNLASDSSTQRLLSPRFALTAAEYLAFEEGKHVLVVMTDMTNYCEALREVSASHGEVPSRKGFPGYLYSDLATLYERAGSLKESPGSLTQLPILTMPSDDITHPVPDLTGYITEGQIVLDRELDRADIYPPVKVLPSLSRLMKDGTGEGFTDVDHPDLSNQLYAAYARAVHVRVLASVVGREGLSAIDQQFLDFGDRFEQELVNQAGARSLEESMALGWQLLQSLPVSELTRLSDQQIDDAYSSCGVDLMGPEQAPTRAAVLELKAERVVVEEAYDFLDEKRLLLAAELLSQLDRYQQLRAELEEKTTQAHQSLVAAIKRHGLQGLSIYPAAHDAHTVKSSERNLMGVTLLDTQISVYPGMNLASQLTTKSTRAWMQGNARQISGHCSNQARCWPVFQETFIACLSSTADRTPGACTGKCYIARY